VLSELKAIGVPSITVMVDVTDRAGREPALIRVEGELGGIGILANNAGNISDKTNVEIHSHRYLFPAALLLCLSLTGTRASALPKIKILATGGTIAGVQSKDGSAGYKSGEVSVEDLLKAIPQVKAVAEISAEQVANIGSQNMTNAVWLKLAHRLNKILQDSGVDGVVITHGSDTLEETAYFLSLVAKSDKPIVMVGAMRPATALSADGPMNLYNAVTLAAALEARGHGVLAVDDSEIHFAREIAKSNTTRIDSFDSPNRGRAGVIVDGRVVLFSAPTLRFGARSEFSVDGVTELPRAEIVYSYANFGRETIDYLWSAKVSRESFWQESETVTPPMKLSPDYVMLQRKASWLSEAHALRAA
jgi:L-asparaginase